MAKRIEYFEPIVFFKKTEGHPYAHFFFFLSLTLSKPVLANPSDFYWGSRCDHVVLTPLGSTCVCRQGTYPAVNERSAFEEGR